MVEGGPPARRKKKSTIVSSVQMSLIFTIMIGIICFMSSFTDLLKFVHHSRQATLKYQTQLCVIVPLVMAFCCQHSFIKPLLQQDKKAQGRGNARPGGETLLAPTTVTNRNRYPSPSGNPISFQNRKLDKTDEDWLSSMGHHESAFAGKHSLFEYDSTTETDTPSQNSDNVKPAAPATHHAKKPEQISTTLFAEQATTKRESSFLYDEDQIPVLPVVASTYKQIATK